VLRFGVVVGAAALIAVILTRPEALRLEHVALTPRATPTAFSVADLLRQLADNAVTEIVVADGTYVVPDASSAAGQQSGLWIDARFAGRTSPVLVRAETVGGVTFSGGGATGWNALSFRDGVHDMTWQGFHFADGDPTQTGVVVFGQNGSVTPLPPYRITLLDLTVDETVTSANPPGVSGDHAVYFSRALGRGPHDIVIDRLTVHAATSGLDSAVHFYGSQPGQPNADTVAIRHLTVYGTDQAVILWDPTLSGITVSDSTITGASQFAVRYEGGTGIMLRDDLSTGSGKHGFYSSLGSSPPGLTFADCDLR
jgi:hypothetical protein